MESIDINGTKLEFETAGSGESVLFIGPGPFPDGCLPFFADMTLRQRYRLILYRQRRLDPANGSAAVSFRQHAADAAGLLSRLDVRAHIVGHSTGAAIGLQLAVDHPELVHSLVLLEPALLSAPSAGSFLEKLGPAIAAYQAGEREDAMIKFLTVACSLDWQTCSRLIEEQVPGAVAQTIRDADNWFASYMPALGEWQFGPEEAASISQPVLSVVGSASDSLYQDGHRLLQSWLPQAEAARVEGAAHLLQIQSPRPVISIVSNFLARHPIKAGSGTAVLR